MRGELTVDKETQVIQSVIAKGLEREELRDEILVQCVRQASPRSMCYQNSKPLFYVGVKNQFHWLVVCSWSNCLILQITECPVEEWAERVWLILCLCAVAWQPSRGLQKYYCAWLRGRARQAPAQRAAHCAQWCLDNCRGAAPRQLPPSTVEIAVRCYVATMTC